MNKLSLEFEIEILGFWFDFIIGDFGLKIIILKYGVLVLEENLEIIYYIFFFL